MGKMGKLSEKQYFGLRRKEASECEQESNIYFVFMIVISSLCPLFIHHIIYFVQVLQSGGCCSKE